TVEDGGTLELGDGRDVVTGAIVPTRLSSPAWPFSVSVESGGRVAVVNASVQNARVTLNTTSARIEGSRFALSAGALRVLGGDATIRNTTLESSIDELAVVSGGRLTIVNGTLRGSAGDGAWVTSGATLIIRNSTL